MKNILILSVVVLTGFAANAQTNALVGEFTNRVPYLPVEIATNSDKGMPMELTFGGSGVTNPKDGSTAFGFDVSLSIQPTKIPVWVGVSQELAWSPSFAGATDMDSTYVFQIVKDRLYLDAGWSYGAIYDRSTLGWRTGPELELEYYTSGNVFLFAGVNYDLFTKDSTGWHTAKDNPLRYSFGIGWAF